MYFYGLSHFIIYHELNDADFTVSPYVDPFVRMDFDTSGTGLKSGSDTYQTTVSFTGNPYNFFSFKFSYLVDMKFDCPATGDIYHISSTQCDSKCMNNFYADAQKYCWKCASQCFNCTGPTNN